MTDIPDLGTSPPAIIPLRDLENIAKLAADRAAEQVLARAPNRDEIEEIAKAAAVEGAKEAARETIEQFLETVGVDPKDKANLRKDFASLRSSRELMEQMKRHGLLAATGLLVVAMLTTFWLGVKGMMVR